VNCGNIRRLNIGGSKRRSGSISQGCKRDIVSASQWIRRSAAPFAYNVSALIDQNAMRFGPATIKTQKVPHATSQLNSFNQT
jgi:hypothetical protein